MSASESPVPLCNVVLRKIRTGEWILVRISVQILIIHSSGLILTVRCGKHDLAATFLDSVSREGGFDLSPSQVCVVS